MKLYQTQIKLAAKSRGVHLITQEILEKTEGLGKIKTGLFKVFIKHTSAGVCINESADPSVRTDFETHFNKMVPENQSYYTHTQEGPDDMPAHIKSTLFGTSLEIPITNGKLNLGTWQGIYLGEFRNEASARSLVITIIGE
ncbi:secondary thiamine-phosphate synthase enzyme YjbQ [Haloflavibacter putidus]|uniref:YjbQ family protein n=1 Tax=Haloflavibacter putidus TaxID=2576776 RepID=A0A507ZGG4_9FLAO|nr:secondary thiamine-phosphate synthase enzyme YjbQ [Haloflavibacter putidus]TQD33985.1 YjbQ family protein [Haloflavibacter putidus]